jgi:hypothetical protein
MLDLGTGAEAARAIQKAAAAAYVTQAGGLPEVVSRLNQLGSMETLRWLVSQAGVPTQRTGT